MSERGVCKFQKVFVKGGSVLLAFLPGGWDADMTAGVRAAVLAHTLWEWVAEQQHRRSLGPLEIEKLPYEPLEPVSLGFLPLAAESNSTNSEAMQIFLPERESQKTHSWPHPRCGGWRLVRVRTVRPSGVGGGEGN